MSTPSTHPAREPARDKTIAEPRALASNPFDDVLEGFYKPRGPVVPSPTPRKGRRAAADKPKPTHYKIVCISLYVEDIERLGAMVAELKRRGHTKANKSQVIRAALDQLDLDRIPKGY